MPLKPLPYREVKRRLVSAGFEEIAQEGSHVKFVKPVGGGLRTAIVPKHREVSIGTIHSILRQSGISIDEWERL